MLIGVSFTSHSFELTAALLGVWFCAAVTLMISQNSAHMCPSINMFLFK